MGIDLRFQTIFSFLFLVCIGIPVWWQTVEVYRAEIPHSQILQLSEHNYSYLQFKIDIVFLSTNQNLKWRQSLEQKKGMLKNVIETNLKFQKLPESLVDAIRTETQTDDTLLQITSQPNDGFIFYILDVHQNQSNQVIFGKYRHGWTYRSLEHVSEEQLFIMLRELIPLIEDKVFLVNHSDSATQPISSRPSTEYSISFSLVNSDMSNILHASWDIERAISEYLDPVFNKLSAIAKFHIGSQVINYGNFLKSPRWDKNQKVFFIDSHQLHHIINPLEWQLESSDISTRPLINFVALIPALNSTPLYIKQEDGKLSTTNGFVIPQWGGLSIINLHNTSIATVPHQITLLPNNLEFSMKTFVSQLRTLLGIPTDNSNNAKFKVVNVPSPSGIADWELDILMCKNLRYNLNNSISTLQSLSRLVQSLPNMVVQDHIRQLVDEAVLNLTKSLELVSAGDYKTAFVYSQRAVDNSEKAFFDSNMISMLYFPDEHKYAVYALPFAPMIFQLLSGLFNELKYRKTRQRNTQ